MTGERACVVGLAGTPKGDFLPMINAVWQGVMDVVGSMND